MSHNASSPAGSVGTPGNGAGSGAGGGAGPAGTAERVLTAAGVKPQIAQLYKQLPAWYEKAREGNFDNKQLQQVRLSTAVFHRPISRRCVR